MMAPLSRLLRFFERVIRLWALFGGLLLLIIVAVTAVNAAGFTANAVARLWGGSVSGLPGYEEAVTQLVGVAAMAMFPYCQFHGGHATVDLFLSKAPHWVRAALAVLAALLMAAVALTMMVMLAQGTLEVRSDGLKTPVLDWSVWIFMPAAVLSCLLWAVAAVLPLWQREAGRDGA